MIRRARALAASGFAVAAVLLGAACAAPDTAGRVDPVAANPALRDSFNEVAPVLSRRCGSIDCHGSTFRNMRVYGYGGQRLTAGYTPDRVGSTAEEVTATYESVIGLEPEIMAEVVQSGGAAPERLTFVRKARGDEDHKGGRRITPGDPSDRCILAWLGGRIDPAAVAACREGACIVPDPMNSAQSILVQCP